MAYYVDLGPEPLPIHYMAGNIRNVRRNVKQYLIFKDKPPIQVLYKAHSIVVDCNGTLVWHKNISKLVGDLQPLSEADQQKLTLQILQSETW